MQSFDDVILSVDAGIAEVRMNRPEVYNAFTDGTIIELNEALREVATDDGVVAVVLTGSGGQFCSGADVDSMPDWSERGAAEYGAFLWQVQEVVAQLMTMSKPTIAAVEGAAIGAGCDFALACDIRVCGPDAYLQEGFVRVGLVPGDGGGWLLPKLVGRATAMEYLLTGDRIPAEEADELGLVAEIAEDPLAAATERAARFKDLPRTAVARTKALTLLEGFDDYRQRAIDYQYECVTDPEHAEAVAALQEDRSPSFDRTYTTAAPE